MKTKNSLRYDHESEVLIAEYRDGISINELLTSWKEIIPACQAFNGMSGMVLDFSDANFDFPAPHHEKIVDFIKLNLSFFEKCRVGIVANNPHNIVVAMLIARADYRYCFRPFTTLKAALLWVQRVS